MRRRMRMKTKNVTWCVCIVCVCMYTHILIATMFVRLQIHVSRCVCVCMYPYLCSWKCIQKPANVCGFIHNALRAMFVCWRIYVSIYTHNDVCVRVCMYVSKSLLLEMYSQACQHACCLTDNALCAMFVRLRICVSRCVCVSISLLTSLRMCMQLNWQCVVWCHAGHQVSNKSSSHQRCDLWLSPRPGILDEAMCIHALCIHVLCIHALCIHALCIHALCIHAMCIHVCNWRGVYLGAQESGAFEPCCVCVCVCACAHIRTCIHSRRVCLFSLPWPCIYVCMCTYICRV